MWSKGNGTGLEKSDNCTDSVTHVSPHSLTLSLSRPIICFSPCNLLLYFKAKKHRLQWSDPSDPISLFFSSLTGFNVSRFPISRDESNQGKKGRRNNLGHFSQWLLQARRLEDRGRDREKGRGGGGGAGFESQSFCNEEEEEGAFLHMHSSPSPPFVNSS